MTSAGPNAREAASIVQRARGKAMAVILQTVEELELEEEDEDLLRRVVKEELHSLADGICALLPSLVDESTTFNALAMEMLADIHAKVAGAEGG